ncbi:MAG: HAMP domain-containing sensor histidine kinase [Chloroflexota bacterium]
MLQKQLDAEIEKRKQVESQSTQLIEELQTRNEELDAFAYTVAHDLLNPLSVLTGLIELTIDNFEGLPPQVIKDNLVMIAESGDKAITIVQELLLLTTASKETVPIMPLDMGVIIGETTYRLQRMIDDSQAEIILPKAWPQAVGYAPWIEEVWVNYISNAIKYGGKPPVIQLGAVMLGNHQIKFWVKDNGLGLTSGEQAQLFTPFTRLQKNDVEGHGLGLAITERIIKKLGGDVGIESRGVAEEGCVFSFTLPIA